MITRSFVDGRRGLVLLAGDLLCFVLFAALGLRSHEDGLTADSVLRVVLPFEAGWLLATYAFGLQGASAAEAQAPRRVLLTWTPAWLIGLLLRTLVFGRALAPTFAIIAFLFNGVLLVAWRCLIAPRVVR